MAKQPLCVRVDDDLENILKAIKEEFGIDKSVVVRIAVAWFAPRFYLALKKLQLELLLNLEEEIEKILREGLAKVRYHV